jgi:hypothetical protein
MTESHDPSPDTSTESTTQGTLSLMSKAAREGAADAREAALRTWAATSLFASRFVYTTCYTVSYGVVFPTTLLALSIPRDNPAVQGMIDGARAAMQKVDEMKGAETNAACESVPPALAPA